MHTMCERNGMGWGVRLGQVLWPCKPYLPNCLGQEQWSARHERTQSDHADNRARAGCRVCEGCHGTPLAPWVGVEDRAVASVNTRCKWEVGTADWKLRRAGVLRGGVYGRAVCGSGNACKTSQLLRRGQIRPVSNPARAPDTSQIRLARCPMSASVGPA